MTRGTRLLAICFAVGVILIVLGLIIGTLSPSVEGAYFDRANGPPAFAGVFIASKPTLLDPADGNLWIGAGVPLVLLATASAALRGSRAQRPSAVPS